MSQIPIPHADNKRPLESRVEEILAKKQAEPKADVSALEQEIDQLVYALYGLTPAEIALVEGRELTAEEESRAQERLKPSLPTEPVRRNRFSDPPLIFTGQPPQGSYSQRLNRVQALAKQTTPAAIQELTAALTDEREAIVWVAKNALRQIGTAEAVTTNQVVGVLEAFIAQTDNASAKAEAEKIVELITT